MKEKTGLFALQERLRMRAHTNKKILPDTARLQTRMRIDRHERAWSAMEIYFFTLFRGNLAYVRVGFMNPYHDVDGNDYSNLCCLEWLGDQSSWKFAVWDPDMAVYVPARVSGGSETGTPEECVDSALKILFGWDVP